MITKMLYKTIILATLLLPVTLFAQSDGFFHIDMNNYGTRDGWEILVGVNGLNNQQFGQPVPGPLGSGLLILTAAGAGYAVLRRKRSRKNTTMLLAFALILGMTSCKKNVDTIDVTEGVRITLNVNNGSKHNINVADGMVTYTNGDRIYVGNNGKYCGQLIYNEASKRFIGEISPTSEDDYLYFYCVSYYAFKNPSNTNYWSFNASRTTYDLELDDQRTLPLLSCGHSTIKYDHEITSYSCWLENKCALVKFNCPEGVNAKVKITGLVTEATLDFANETITPTETTGEVTLYSNGLTEKWAILLPQTVSTPPTVSIAGYESDIELPTTPWEINNNDYITTGVTISNVPALFKAKDHIVTFSPGNLQATTSNLGVTWTWSFASNQYDYIGDNTANNNVNGNGTVSANGAVDLFGWSTDNTYYGINNSFNSFDHDNPSTYSNATYDGDFKDWGGLTIGTDEPGTWRTMTVQEWYDLLNARNASTVNGTTNARYTMAEINMSDINADGTGVYGLIIFPDKTIGTTPEGVTWGTINTYTTNDAWSTRTKCTTEGWNALESKGCVFLPAGGYREGSTVHMLSTGNEPYGGYWSSSIETSKPGFIDYLFFDKKKCYAWSDDARQVGHSVRLVRQVE